jgi:hypothetical protein
MKNKFDYNELFDDEIVLSTISRADKEKTVVVNIIRPNLYHLNIT